MSRVSRVPVHGGNPRRGDDSNGRNEIITCGHHRVARAGGGGGIDSTTTSLSQNTATSHSWSSQHQGWSGQGKVRLYLVDNDGRRQRFCKFLI